MTSEEKEAIEELKILKNDYWEDDGYGYATAECQKKITALDMAIEALQQEPCDDNWRVYYNHGYAQAKRDLSCEDCISRQAVLELMGNYDLSMGEVVKAIHALPSVTLKTGKWIDDADKIDAQFGKHTYKCSECGKYAEYFVSGTEVWWDRIKPNFCPNCGCQMRGDSNGNE